MKTMVAVEPPESVAQARVDFFDALPGHFERLRWNHEQLAAFQTRTLRRLLRVAVDGSPFHRNRLRGIDPDTFELADLATLPPMNKSEMMANYDDVGTDRRLSLELVNRHLDAVGEEPVLLLDRYVALATGGSSGVRGVFVSDLAGAAQHMAAVIRGGLAGLARAVGWPPPGPAPIAIVAAPSCIHATRALSSLFLPGRLATVTFAPVTMPLADIVERVQQAQPLILVGYPSVIAKLADARGRGELDVSPMVIAVTSEQLTLDQFDRITAGLGVAPTNSYGTSEGLMGATQPGSDAFEFASDLAIVEYVDGSDRFVADGEAADHVLITNLFNTTQPLIRYRIDDVMTPAAPAAEHGHQRATLQGRNDGALHLGEVDIHPITIRTLLTANPAVSEFQVQLVDDEIVVKVVGTDIDIDAIERNVGAALDRAGAPAAVRITAMSVDQIPRDPNTGKVKEFVTT